MKSSPPEYFFKPLKRIDPAESTGLLEMVGKLDQDFPIVPPASSRILSYCWQEINSALEVGDERAEWLSLAKLLVEAEEAERSHNSQALCEVLFQVGQLCGILILPSVNRYLEGMDAQREKQAREKPLHLKNRNNKTCRDIARNMALEWWKLDERQQIRTGQMADYVWQFIYNHKDIPKDIKAALPDNGSGLKKWIREVAPDYAKLGGAPRKGKK